MFTSLWALDRPKIILLNSSARMFLTCSAQFSISLPTDLLCESTLPQSSEGLSAAIPIYLSQARSLCKKNGANPWWTLHRGLDPSPIKDQNMWCTGQSPHWSRLEVKDKSGWKKGNQTPHGCFFEQGQILTIGGSVPDIFLPMQFILTGTLSDVMINTEQIVCSCVYVF